MRLTSWAGTSAYRLRHLDKAVLVHNRWSGYVPINHAALPLTALPLQGSMEVRDHMMLREVEEKDRSIIRQEGPMDCLGPALPPPGMIMQVGALPPTSMIIL